MNYRHAFHAGNFADVLKHAVLVHVLAYLARKQAPFRVVDTHAGIGRYDLFADAATRTGEWRDGVGRVYDLAPDDPAGRFLAPLLALVRAENGGGPLAIYPGSPLLARALLRREDRLMLTEAHPEDAAALEALFARDRQTKVFAGDGWMAVRSLLPPPERRGLTLIDPPFEVPGEFGRMLRAIDDAHARFPTGTMLIWYPVKTPDAVAAFLAGVAARPLPPTLRIELRVRAHGEGPLAAAGLVVVNPPYLLEAACREGLPALAERLAQGPGAGWTLEWLVEERAARRG